jgi:hypothetical protein
MVSISWRQFLITSNQWHYTFFTQVNDCPWTDINKKALAVPVNNFRVTNRSRAWIDGAVVERNRHSVRSCFKIDYCPTPTSPPTRAINKSQHVHSTTYRKVRSPLTRSVGAKGDSQNLFTKDRLIIETSSQSNRHWTKQLRDARISCNS